MSGVESIQGMFLPLPTPFDGDGNLDEQLLAALAEFYVGKGVDALFLFGSYGQGPAMTVEQRKRGLEVVLRAVGDRVPVVPQIGAVDPYTSRELGLHARAQGVPAVGLVGPYYYADRTEAELSAHLRLVDEAVQLPILLYNNPQYQGYSISPPFLAKLREQVPSLFGLKIAKGGISDILAYRRAMGDSFRLFAPQQNLYPGMLVGQSGTISPPLSLAPELGVAVVRAVREGRHEEAQRLQLAVLRFASELPGMRRWGRAVFAEGLRHLGFPLKQYPRWPTPELPDDVKAGIRAAIDAARQLVVAV